MNLKSLIINVDDLGLHPAVQRAVEKCSTEGIVNSASIVANGPFINEVKQIHGISFGSHLNILRGHPLSPPSEIKSLLNNEGIFLGNYNKLFYRYFFNQISLKEVRLEFSRQIELLLEKGFSLFHIDTEKHVHTWPSIMEITSELAEKYNIPWVRWPSENTSPILWGKNNSRARLLNIFLKYCKKNIKINYPDGSWGIVKQGKNLNPEAFKEYISNYSDHTMLEIVCHPGDYCLKDPELSNNLGSMRVKKQWKDELKSLIDPEWKIMINQEKINCVNFANIKKL